MGNASTVPKFDTPTATQARYQIVKHSIIKRLIITPGITRIPGPKFRKVYHGGETRAPSPLTPSRPPAKANSVEDIIFKFPIFGCARNHQPFLNPEILEHFLPFIMDRTLFSALATCPHWFITIYDFLVEKWSDHIVQEFKRKYQDYLLLEGVNLSIQPVYTEIMTTRCDLILYATVLPSCKRQCVELSYAGLYLQLPDDGKAASKPSRFSSGAFRFETLRAGSSRAIWLKKDNSSVHGDELLVAATSNVPELCPGDRVELAFNLANAVGVVDPFTVEWFDIKFVGNKDVPPRTYGRRCSSECEKHLWYDRENFYSQGVDRIRKLDMFGPQWKLSSTSYSGVDIITTRSTFDVSVPGIVPQSANVLGIRFSVLPKNQPITVPLKRTGMEHDRLCHQQVRVGDTVVIYASSGGLPAEY